MKSVFTNDALMMDPAVGALLVGCFVLLFASAALHKWRDLNRFADIFAAFEIFPAIARARLAWLIPALETAVAVALVLPASRSPAVAVGAALLIGYAIAIALNLRAGRTAIDCGCGAADLQRPIAAWMVWRNLLLSALLAAVGFPWGPRPFEVTDGVTIGFGLAAIGVLYGCAEKLVGPGPSGRSSLRGSA